MRVVGFGCSCLLVTATTTGCGWGSGSQWVQQPLDEERSQPAMPYGGAPSPRHGPRPTSRTLGARPRDSGPVQPGASANENDRTGGGGRVLGKFRNTYYDFPREEAGSGDAVSLMNARCEVIAKVPRTFHEAVCVQGSGSLRSGGTVSFAKRDCSCAETCPRTGQKICFEVLDPARFPHGRGAAGKPIKPLRSLAADTSVLPMGTAVYIPELDGVPRVETGEALDGCFVVEDRGLEVKGEHVDLFTGDPCVTTIMNEKLPSNQGVTIVLDAPKCAHLAPR